MPQSVPPVPPKVKVGKRVEQLLLQTIGTIVLLYLIWAEILIWA